MNFFLDTAGSPSHQVMTPLVDEEHSGRVAVEDLAHSVQQLHQQILDTKAAQTDFRHGQQVIQAIAEIIAWHSKGR